MVGDWLLLAGVAEILRLIIDSMRDGARQRSQFMLVFTSLARDDPHWIHRESDRIPRK